MSTLIASCAAFVAACASLVAELHGQRVNRGTRETVEHIHAQVCGGEKGEDP